MAKEIVENTDFIHDDNLGQVKISDAVIAVCAVNATLKVKGVAELAGGFTDSITESIRGKESVSKGVKVNQQDDGLIIDIYIMVRYGVKIPVVAWDIQNAVKEEVETMTEKPVQQVNIHVQGVVEREKGGKV